jgi:DNA-binding transcriptional LysR family regulator
LEELIGRRLLERRPHGLALTDAGAVLLPVVRGAFDRIGDTLDTLRTDAGAGPRTLRVHMPPSFLHQCGLEVLHAFRAAFPDILIDVSSSNGTGLPEGGDLDVAVVYDRPQGGEAVRDLLWMVREAPACAPALAARAAGLMLAEFLGGNVLLHVKHPGEPPGLLWAAFAGHHNIPLSADRGLAFETAVLAVQGAVAGGGVVLADLDLFAREIADGRLVLPFEAMRGKRLRLLSLRSPGGHGGPGGGPVPLLDDRALCPRAGAGGRRGCPGRLVVGSRPDPNATGPTRGRPGPRGRRAGIDRVSEPPCPETRSPIPAC